MIISEYLCKKISQERHSYALRIWRAHKDKAKPALHFCIVCCNIMAYLLRCYKYGFNVRNVYVLCVKKGTFRFWNLIFPRFSDIFIIGSHTRCILFVPYWIVSRMESVDILYVSSDCKYLLHVENFYIYVL